MKNPRYKIRNDEKSYCYFKGKCADSALHIFAFKIKEKKMKREILLRKNLLKNADSALHFSNDFCEEMRNDKRK